MTISVIVPTLNEATVLDGTLSALRKEFNGELWVVDGGSRDRTKEIALAYTDRVLGGPLGLARQCNLAARHAAGDILFFVAADCVVPAGWVSAVEGALQSPYVVGGGFTLQLDDDALAYRILAWGGNFRSRYLRVVLGDQGLFVRRNVFLTVGGMREGSLIPHAKLCFDIAAHGEVVILSDTMLSSSRKWKERGLLATTFTHLRTYLKFKRREL